MGTHTLALAKETETGRFFGSDFYRLCSRATFCSVLLPVFAGVRLGIIPCVLVHARFSPSNMVQWYCERWQVPTDGPRRASRV